MELLEKNFDIAFSVPEGITKLRELILTLAMRGKLIPQNPDAESARELLEKIEKERSELINDGKLKKSNPLPEIKVDEIPYELPEGWEWVRLGQISQYNQRKKISSGEISADMWLLDLEDIEKITSRLLCRIQYHERQSKSTKSFFESGDILYGKLRPYLDKVIVAETSGACTTEIVPISPYRGVDSHFLRWLLKRPDFIRHVNSLMYGVKMPRLGTKDAVQSLHPLPPHEEQKRIVKKIEELFALCEQLEQLRNQKQQLCDSLQSATSHKLLSGEAFNKTFEFATKNFLELYSKKEHIKNLQDVILELAMRGKLVSRYPHVEPARELLKKIEKERSELIKDGKLKKSDPLPEIKADEIPYELPEGWEWVRLGSLGQIYNGNSLNDSQKRIFSSTQVSDSLPYLSTKDIGYRSELECLSSSINIPLNTLGFRVARAFSPLICSEGGSAGKKISFIKQNTYFGNKLFAINEYFPLAEKFIFFNYQSINFQKSFQLKMTGIIGGISLANFQQILIPLPPLEEQKRIIKKIEELFALCESLSQQVNASQEKQSDLLKAVMLKIQEV
jgi:type I restriction enzyme S subunit